MSQPTTLPRPAPVLMWAAAGARDDDPNEIPF